MLSQHLNPLSFLGKIKLIHMTWMAFFISFVMLWLNLSPLMLLMARTLSMDKSQIKTILILNVALAIPASMFFGFLVDRFGTKRTYSTLLALVGVLGFMVAFASIFEQLLLTRFLSGFISAGFVIGIRMVSEWFPARQDRKHLQFPPTLEPGKEFDGYLIEAELHTSNRAKVYRALNRETGTQVCLKAPSMLYVDDADYIEHFLHEEWAGKRIHHENVLKMLSSRREKS